MSVIETIVGFVPTVRDRVKSVLNFLTSTTGKVTCSILLALFMLGYTHHMGVESQKGKIETLTKQLGAAKLLLAAEQAKPKPQPCPEKAEEPNPAVKSWLEGQVQTVETLKIKPKLKVYHK
jgi:hypothetical protein